MNVPLFISRRIRYKGRVVVTVVAVSFLVMIIAVAVSSGFRREIHQGISSVSGDIQLTLPSMNYLGEDSPVASDQSWMAPVKAVEGISSVDPVVYRAGIVKESEDIYGVVVKGVENPEWAHAGDSVALGVSIPSSLAEKSGLSRGDRLLTYFVGEKVKVRQFNITSIYDPPVKTDTRYLVYADIDDMRRLNAWDDGQASLFEVTLNPDYRDEKSIGAITSEIGGVIHDKASSQDDILVASSVRDRFPQIFDWLELIDFNVLFVLMLMIVVAGVNMISGLLIMLFENISTIGMLKSIGMRNVDVARVFLNASAALVLKGMLIGNALAAAFCMIQNSTHIIKLDPDNYFVSFVPVHLDLGAVLAADTIAFAAIMVLLLIPSLFIAKVDPAQTVRMK